MAEIVVEDGTGIVTANAYASAEEVDEINSYRVGSQWNTLTDDEMKENLIIWATNILDYRVKWNGKKTHETQGLAWPRTGTRRDGVCIDDNIVPKQVKEAVAILANHLIDGDPEAADTSSKITMIQADVVVLKFDPYAPTYKFPNGIDLILEGLGFVSMGRGGAKRIIKH